MGVKTIAQHEIPFMHFGQSVLKSAAQHAILNFIVCQIKGEYQFTYLEHALCVGEGSKEGYNDLSLTRGNLPVPLSQYTLIVQFPKTYLGQL